MKKNKLLDDQPLALYLAGLGYITMGIGTGKGLGLTHGYFSLQNLKTRKKLGANVKEKDIDKASTTSIIVFSTVESVDDAIGKLERLKKLMTKSKRKKK